MSTATKKQQISEAIANFNRGFNLVEYAKQRMEWKQSGHGILVRCPFHQDHTPSMYVTPDMAYCFVCGQKYDAFAFVKGVEKIATSSVLDKDVVRSSAPANVAKENHPSSKFIELAHRTLLNTRRKLEYLTAKRGLSLDVIKEYKIGYIKPPFAKYKMPRYSFPAWNEYGQLVTCSYRKDPYMEYEDKYPENKKYVIHTGSKSMLYNMHNVQYYDWMVYCGGQIDALSLLQYGIPAIGAMGEGVFKTEWADTIRDRTVYILLDNDVAGRDGSERAARIIHNPVVVSWPTGFPSKYDVNAAINDTEFGIDGIISLLRGMGADIREYKPYSV